MTLLVNPSPSAAVAQASALTSPWLSIIRSVLMAVGGILVTLGYMDESTVSTVIGAILSVLTAIWGATDKLKVQTLIEVKEKQIDAKEQTIQRLEESKDTQNTRY
jgi:hypothetical protein